MAFGLDLNCKRNVACDFVRTLRLRCVTYVLRSYITWRRRRVRATAVPADVTRRDCVVINTRGYNGVVTGRHGTHMYVSPRGFFSVPSVPSDERLDRRLMRRYFPEHYLSTRRYATLCGIQDCMSVWWHRHAPPSSSVCAISFDCSGLPAASPAFDVYTTQLQISLSCLVFDTHLPTALSAICFVTNYACSRPGGSPIRSAEANEMAHLLFDEKHRTALLRVTLGSPNLTHDRLLARIELLFSELCNIM